MRSLRLALWLVVATGAAGAGGCHAPPVTIRMDLPADASPPIAPGAGLWEGAGAIPLPAGSRIAILECSLEFVTMKQETPTPRQARIGGPILPASALVDLSGVFRKRVAYPRDITLGLPRRAADGIVDALAARGLEVLEPETVACCTAYRDLERTMIVRSSPAHQLDPRGSDAGRPNQFRVYPALPLRVLTARLDDVEAPRAEVAVLDELDADIALRLQLRVGIFQGRVSIERGSVVELRTRTSSSRLVSSRSVVSHRRVAKAGAYEIVAGRRYTVDWTAFERGVEAMVPRYALAALEHSLKPES